MTADIRCTKGVRKNDKLMKTEMYVRDNCEWMKIKAS